MIAFLTQWLFPVVHIIGLAIAIWAFRKSKKKGYIVIAIFFALSIFSHVAMPKIKRSISKQETTSISDKKRKEMDQEINEIYHRYYEVEGLEPKMASIKIRIPFGESSLLHSSM